MHSLTSTLCSLYALCQKAVVCLVPQTIWHLPPDWFAPLRWLTLLIWLRRQRRGRKLGCPYPKYCGYSPWSFQRSRYTKWIVAKDLTHKELYYRTYNDLTVRVIYLDKVQPQGKRLKLRGFKDTTDELKSRFNSFFRVRLTVWVPKVEPSYEALGTHVLDPSGFYAGYPRLIYSDFNPLRRTKPLVPLMTSSNCLGTVGATIRDYGSSGCEGD